MSERWNADSRGCDRFRGSLSAAQERLYDPRAAPTMHHGHDKKWFFVGCIGDKIVSDVAKPQRSRCQISSTVSQIWKDCKIADGIKQSLPHPICRTRVVRRDKLPDFGDIPGGFGVEIKATDGCHFAR